MKIEKLNDNQIRCTLTQADLKDRHLKLSELAYGTEKAKALFQDMMQQAAFEFGFEAENIPLMIEAIPSSADSIILIITKVEDPEELDTRFSKFAPSPAAASGKKHAHISNKLAGSEDFLALLEKVKNATAKPAKVSEAAKIQLFSFTSIDIVIQAAKLLNNRSLGPNTLYKDSTTGRFTLALAKSDQAPADFHRLCNMLSEYGVLESSSNDILAHLEEHGDIIVQMDAMQKLAQL